MDELLVKYGLDELSVEEMLNVMEALAVQVHEDVEELKEAIIKECTDEQEKAKGGES
jgi:hypothetical protein